MDQSNDIDTRLLRQLLRLQTPVVLIARVDNGGFVLAIRTDSSEQILKAQRGHDRTFKCLDAVATYVKRLGANVFKVDLSDRSASEKHVAQ